MLFYADNFARFMNWFQSQVNTSLTRTLYKNSHLLKEYLVVLMPKRGQFFPQFKLQLITSTCGQLICSFHHFWQSQLLFHSNIPNLFFFVKIQTSFGRILKRSHPNWQQSVSQINLCSRSENKHLFRK